MNAKEIHELCTEQADAFAAADDLLPIEFRDNYPRILAACMIAHDLNIGAARVMFGLHLDDAPAAAQPATQEQAPDTSNETEKTRDTEQHAGSWPRKNGENWIDSASTVFDKALHGWNKSAKMPSVKVDGTFRNARGAKKVETVDKPAPVETQAPADDETKMVEANQVLSTFKNHIAEATTVERLAQLGTQLDLMGFTPSELTVARRWIAEKTELIKSA